MAVQRRNTRQRKLVLDAVRQSYNHPTADEIYNVVRAQDDKISRGTVYRNLNLLADAGERCGSIKKAWCRLRYS